MPVEISASLDHDTVTQLLSELLPLTIDLGEERHKGDRWIQIEPPQLLEFVRDRGIRLQTGAKLQWTVAGVALPFTIQSVRFLLTPTIDAARGRLNLAITLEETDLKNLPKAIDRGVVAQLNARLAARPDRLGWDYGKALSLRKPMPAQMAPLEAFEMDAGAMTVSIDDRGLRLGLALPMRFTRRSS